MALLTNRAFSFHERAYWCYKPYPYWEKMVLETINESRMRFRTTHQIKNSSFAFITTFFCSQFHLARFRIYCLLKIAIFVKHSWYAIHKWCWGKISGHTWRMEWVKPICDRKFTISLNFRGERKIKLDFLWTSFFVWRTAKKYKWKMLFGCMFLYFSCIEVFYLRHQILLTRISLPRVVATN